MIKTSYDQDKFSRAVFNHLMIAYLWSRHLMIKTIFQLSYACLQVNTSICRARYLMIKTSYDKDIFWSRLLMIKTPCDQDMEDHSMEDCLLSVFDGKKWLFFGYCPFVLGGSIVIPPNTDRSALQRPVLLLLLIKVRPNHRARSNL